MFYPYVLHFRQEILLLGVGIVLVLAFFLSYLPMKRPRRPETYQPEDSPRPQTWREAFRYMPWILVLVYAACMIYSIIFITVASQYPLNY
jgi:hypothetical protein